MTRSRSTDGAPGEPASTDLLRDEDARSLEGDDMDSTDSGLEIIIPPNFEPVTQERLHAHQGVLQASGGFMGSLFSIVGLNIGTVIAIGTKVVQDIISLVGNQPVFDSIKGVKIAGKKKRVWIAITDNDAGPPTWPAGQ